MQELQALKRLISTPGLNDLVINGCAHAQADFGQGLEEIANPFQSNESAASAFVELALSAGARLDIAKPISDFSLQGVRFHAVLAQGVSANPLLSVRKHPEGRLELAHLVEAGMISEAQSRWFLSQLELRSNLIISGPTSSGKTTLLRALLGELNERVVVLEQTPELMVCAPAIAMTERSANQDGVGAIDLDELVVHALRMRPDRIVVGEVRSKEFRVLLQAMNNGHRGTLATLHASSLSQVAQRSLVLGLLAGMQESLTSTLVGTSVDFVIQLGRTGDRRVIEAIGRPLLSNGQLEIELLEQL